MAADWLVLWDRITQRLAPGPLQAIADGLTELGWGAGTGTSYPVQQVTLTGNLAYTLPAGAPADQVISVVFTQDATGGHTVTYGGQPVSVDPAPGASTEVEFWPGGSVVHPGAGGGVSGTAVITTDPRLSDARTPLAHTHPASDISDSTTTGRTVLTAVDAAAARTAIGAGTSSLGIGTTGTTAAAGDHTHTLDQTTDTATRVAMTPAERTKLTNTSGTNTGDQTLPTWTTLAGKPAVIAAGATAADARTAIGAGTSSLAIGTTGTTAAAGDHTHTLDQTTDTATRVAMTPAERTKLTNTSGTNTGDQTLPTWTTLAGKPAVIAAGATAADARTAIGAGTSSLGIGTTAGTAKEGNYTPPDATGAVKGLVQLAGDLTGTAASPALTTSGVTAGSYTLSSITVDAKGRVTAASSGAAGSVADATTTTKGVVQLAGDLAGTAVAPTVVAASETVAGKVELATTAEATTGTDTARAVTPAGLKAVGDTKAAVSHTHDDRYYTETEADARFAPAAQTINAQTGTTYTLVASDAGKLVTLTNAAAITLTVPGSTFTAGQRVDCLVAGAGMVTATAGSGLTLNGTPTLVSRARWSAFTILFTSATAAVVVGDLASA